MLTIVIEATESFNNETQKFVPFAGATLDLEHSLVSLSKWESKHQIPFLGPGKKTAIQIFDYMKAMVITPNADLEALYHCSQANINEIQAYIDSPQSATTFGMMPERKGPGEIITAELIYYWMVAFTIPWEAQHWHLNRLFALVRICNVKNSKPTKMSRQELSMRRAEINAQRRAELGTSG